MIYALTATGGRREGMALLGEYIAAQTYTGPLTWLVVDDCTPRTEVTPPRDNVTVKIVHPGWRWRIGMNSQAACLSEGLRLIQDDAAVIVLEDDDCYLPGHMENVLGALQRFDLVGEKISRYYNVATRRWRELPGRFHASMCSVAVKGGALRTLRDVCLHCSTALDVKLWKGYSGPKRLLDSANVIGIKGLPGRSGIGVGHRPKFGHPDRGDMLRQWAGDYADNYEIFRDAA